MQRASAVFREKSLKKNLISDHVANFLIKYMRGCLVGSILDN